MSVEQKMTRESFQKKYHDYMTQDRVAAQAEADSVNANAADFRCVVMEFPGMGCCLMLESAASTVQALFPEL